MGSKNQGYSLKQVVAREDDQMYYIKSTQPPQKGFNLFHNSGGRRGSSSAYRCAFPFHRASQHVAAKWPCGLASIFGIFCLIGVLHEAGATGAFVSFRAFSPPVDAPITTINFGGLFMGWDLA